MKKGLFFIPIVLSLLLAPGCIIDINDDDSFFNCVNGSGPIVTRTLHVDQFDGVSLNMDADVFITQGPVFEVQVEGQNNIIDELERDARNGVWEIETDRCITSYSRLDIFITMPDIRSLINRGSGEIFGENDFVVNDLDLRISGSGDMDLSLEADDIEIIISGSGELHLIGSCDTAEHIISGSGDMEAFDLLTEETEILISGSGDAQVHAIDFLKVTMSGSGDVFYKGNPVTDITITGSGDVIDAN